MSTADKKRKAAAPASADAAGGSGKAAAVNIIAQLQSSDGQVGGNLSCPREWSHRRSACVLYASIDSLKRKRYSVGGPAPYCVSRRSSDYFSARLSRGARAMTRR